MSTHFINIDLVKVYKSADKKGNFLILLAWGDEVTLVEQKTAYYKIELKIALLRMAVFSPNLLRTIS